MPDKIVNHFVLADGSVARYSSSSLDGLTIAETNILDTDGVTTYEQVANVIKHDGYIWGNGSTRMEALLVAQNNRQAVEFSCKPNTQYVIKGMSAGTNQNYGIGFFANSTEGTGVYSIGVVYDATQEAVNGDERCTVVTTPDGCNYIRYNVYPNASYDKQLEVVNGISYIVKESAITSEIQRASDSSLLTTDKTIVGAINEVYAGGGGASGSPWILPPNGSEDMTTAIESMLSAYGVCQLVSGNYNISASGITMPDGSALVGAGSGTTITLGGAYDSTVGQCVTMGDDCTVKDITFKGWATNISLSGTLVERHGILWTSDTSGNPFRGIVDNCRFLYFKGGAITCKSTGSDISNCLNVSNCYMYYCRAGINLALQSEYHRFANCHVTACYYGCINNGGNNMFSNCLFTKNTVGFLMDNSGNDKINNSHGSAIGCTFNHSGNNTGIGIQIKNMSNGFVFTGCQVFYSMIELTDASGIAFDHCNFGQSEETIVSGGALVMFDGCMYESAPTINITNNNNVHFNNCYIRSTGALVNVS